ncbi:endonuclease domain-containing protein [Aliikangiella coralliicola]|uniref:Endonuclease domain-containing protein n=1 Tax=Aliikangiella coralliicola TaxID=2592383 RepID=A0A545U8P8_9GAMM|nr:DUF559 domain-containing protein [Aliikangiella coralliicola]TQV85847.1 endonuclease domain-containing protein [Aliikangiella coralliicola]
METLLNKAKRLRTNQTTAEQQLWRAIRAKRFENRKFYRQFIISPYVVDFVNRDLKLVVELDGGQHMDSQRQDIVRTKYLESKGYKVIRFWNNQILSEFEAVLLSLSLTLSQRERELKYLNLQTPR